MECILIVFHASLFKSAIVFFSVILSKPYQVTTGSFRKPNFACRHKKVNHESMSEIKSTFEIFKERMMKKKVIHKAPCRFCQRNYCHKVRDCEDWKQYLNEIKYEGLFKNIL